MFYHQRRYKKNEIPSRRERYPNYSKKSQCNTPKNLSLSRKYATRTIMLLSHMGKGRKLLFYLNVRKKEVIFGISHRGTDILEKFPLLPSLADETKTSVMKFSIKKLEDIKKKWIHKLIDIILSSQLDFINEKYMVTNQKTQKCLSQTKSTKKGKGCSYWAYGRWRKKSSG